MLIKFFNISKIGKNSFIDHSQFFKERGSYNFQVEIKIVPERSRSSDQNGILKVNNSYVLKKLWLIKVFK